MLADKELTDFEQTLDFQKIVDKIAQQDDNRFHAKMQHKYSPTELSGCIRNSYYSRLFPEEYNDESYRHFLLGNILHELFQKNLEKDKRETLFKDILGDKIQHIENEKAFQFLVDTTKTNGRRVIISGRLDTIIYLKGRETPIICDYKSTQNSYYNIKEPKEAHVDQVNFYLGPGLSEFGMIVYIDKRNLSIVQHTIPYSQERFDKTIQFCIDLDNALENKVVPIVNVQKQDDEGDCKYCRHKERCYKLEDELKVKK